MAKPTKPTFTTAQIDTSPLILSPIEAARKAAILLSSPGFDTTGERAFKGEL